ncbi:MAG: hypothetical protein NTV52_09210 [Acidobacteria bacterium]|nr:hypothetical protein [Acidobacteriota bacterium]
MRVVVDASIDPRLVAAFVGDEVWTLFDFGWQHLKDNVLVKQLECASVNGGTRLRPSGLAKRSMFPALLAAS